MVKVLGRHLPQLNHLAPSSLSSRPKSTGRAQGRARDRRQRLAAALGNSQTAPFLTNRSHTQRGTTTAAPRLITTPTHPAAILTMRAAVKTGGRRLLGAPCQGTDMAEVALTSPMAPAPALNPASPNNVATANSSTLPPTVNIHSTYLSTSLNRCTPAPGTEGPPAPLHPQPRVWGQASDPSLLPQNRIHPGSETRPPQLPATTLSRVVDTSHSM